MNQINTTEFETLIKENYTFIYITATWCGPCKAFSPIVSEVAELYKDKVNFGKLDADLNSQKLEELGVKALPTVVIFKNGIETERMSGLTSKQKLVNTIEVLLDDSSNFATDEDF